MESASIIKAISLLDLALNGRRAAKLPPYHFEILLVESPDDDGWTVLNDSAELGTFDDFEFRTIDKRSMVKVVATVCGKFNMLTLKIQIVVDLHMSSVLMYTEANVRLSEDSPTTMKRLTLGGVVSLTIIRRTVPINEVI